MAERYVVRRDQIGSERIDDEVVVISFDTSHYYCLNRTATVVWSVLSNRASSVDDVGDILATMHDLPCEQARVDVRELVTALEAEGLVERTDHPEAAERGDEPAASHESGAYIKPRFEKFGTLEQLMLAGE